MNFQNKIEKDTFNKLCQVFDRQLTGDESLEELVKIKWYEIYPYRAINYFFDDIDYLSMAGEIDASTYDSMIIKNYCRTISDCHDRGLELDKEISFCNDSVNKIKRKLSIWYRVLPITLMFISLICIILINLD